MSMYKIEFFYSYLNTMTRQHDQSATQLISHDSIHYFPSEMWSNLFKQSITRLVAYCAFIIYNIILYSIWFTTCIRYTNRENTIHNNEIISRRAGWQTQYNCTFSQLVNYSSSYYYLVQYQIEYDDQIDIRAQRVCFDENPACFNLTTRSYSICFLRWVNSKVLFDIRHNNSDLGCDSYYYVNANYHQFNNCYPQITLKTSPTKSQRAAFLFPYIIVNGMLLMFVYITIDYIAYIKRLATNKFIQFMIILTLQTVAFIVISIAFTPKYIG